MRAIFVAVALSLPALAQTSKPSQPATQKAAPVKAEAAEQLRKLLQVADPAQQIRNRASIGLIDKLLAAQAQAQALQPNLAARPALLQEALLLQKFAGGTPQPPSPLLHGDYAEAMQALDAAREKMLAAADAKAAFAALDAATKALMDARSALWKQKEAAKPPATKPAKSKDD